MPDGSLPLELVTRADALVQRAVRTETREVDFIASTDAIDSYSEVIDQASWRLDTFKSNPVILYGHMSRELPIGQATRCEVVNGKLEITVRFASEAANPMAEQVWKLVQERVLRAVSVGFRPTNGKYEMRDGKEVFVWYGCDLREVSVVSIPANSEALAKMKAFFVEQEKGVHSQLQHELQKAGIRVSPKSGLGSLIHSVVPMDGFTLGADHTVPNQTSGYWLNGATNTTILGVDGAISIGGMPFIPRSTAADAAPTYNFWVFVEQENIAMNEKELREALAKAEKSLDDERTAAKALAERADAAEKRAASLESEKSVIEKELEKAAADRDAALERATAAEAEVKKAADEALEKSIELEVDALVGKKIAATEKDEFVALRKSNPDLFARMVEKRADMALTERVVEPDTKAVGGTLVSDPGAAFWNTPDEA